MISTNATDIAIDAEGLVKVFGTTRAVDGVGLRVDRGMVYGVLGPNGAGKTTTISMLTTLLRPDGGHAQIFGHDVVREPNAVRQLIGVTGQYASVDEKISGIENMIVFGRLLSLGQKGAKRRGLDLLDAFGLSEAATRPVSKYSGGMRRRLDLAASLIAQPPLIFLDEPTTGLDPRTRGQMWDVIRGLVANGSTVLLTTQYLDEADQLADRIAVIDSGKVVAEGTPNDLKSLVGTATLQLSLADTSVTSTALATVEQILDSRASATPERGRITAPMADPERITDLLIALRADDIRLAAVSVEQPTLDEVFMTITGHSTSDTQNDAEPDARHRTRRGTSSNDSEKVAA